MKRQPKYHEILEGRIDENENVIVGLESILEVKNKNISLLNERIELLWGVIQTLVKEKNNAL